jgi:chromate transporter
VWTAGIKSGADFALGAAAFLLLYIWKTPPWLVVVLCAVVGGLLGLLPPLA